jgi:CheY-like chemotaxis protein
MHMEMMCDEKNTNVLIVDDERMIMEAVSAYFSKMGCNTHLVENGHDALSVFEKVPIDFVILETVFLVSILSRVFISRQFEEYVRQTQKKQADAITLEKTDIDIYSLAKEIMQGFKIGFEEKKIDVKLYGEETHVFADRKRAAWASAFRFQKQL